MNRVIIPVLVAVMAVAVIASAPASAQDAQQGLGKNMPSFTDCDLNEDGKITADEFNKARSERITNRAKEGRQMKNLANAPSFEDIDTDGDGSVSREEFNAHQAEHRAKRKP